MAIEKPKGLGGFFDAFREAYGEGREEWSKAFRESRKSQGKSENAPRIDEMSGAYPTGIRLTELVQDLTGRQLSEDNKNNRFIRNDLGIGAKQGTVPRAGQFLGTMAADATQDNTRSFWWLLNAAQAAGNVIAEKAMNVANPRLYGKSIIRDPKTNRAYNIKNEDLPERYVSGKTPKKGVSIDDDGYLYKRNFEPGDLAALGIPTGVAINTGLGLMTPFGGAEGYKAAIPSDEDPSKTDNVLGEVALKYFMGKTGNLLPYDEFSQVRPDVSREEYNKYQAWKYDKNEDWNPLDGDTSMLAGALRTTTEGIHGPELQFLGRSLPVTTGVIPYAFALTGGVAGVKRSKPIRGGLVGGTAGLAIGQIAGNLIEQERRRRNQVENQLDYQDN